MHTNKHLTNTIKPVGLQRIRAHTGGTNKKEKESRNRFALVGFFRLDQRDIFVSDTAREFVNRIACRLDRSVMN